MRTNKNNKGAETVRLEQAKWTGNCGRRISSYIETHIFVSWWYFTVVALCRKAVYFFFFTSVNIMHIFSHPTSSSCTWGAAVATNCFLTRCWLALPGYARILITSIATKITTRLQNQFDCTPENKKKNQGSFSAMKPAILDAWPRVISAQLITHLLN